MRVGQHPLNPFRVDASVLQAGPFGVVTMRIFDYTTRRISPVVRLRGFFHALLVGDQRDKPSLLLGYEEHFHPEFWVVYAAAVALFVLVTVGVADENVLSDILNLAALVGHRVDSIR